MNDDASMAPPNLRSLELGAWRQGHLTNFDKILDIHCGASHRSGVESDERS